MTVFPSVESMILLLHGNFKKMSTCKVKWEICYVYIKIDKRHTILYLSREKKIHTCVKYIDLPSDIGTKAGSPIWIPAYLHIMNHGIYIRWLHSEISAHAWNDLGYLRADTNLKIKNVKDLFLLHT